jgi:PhnB protein
MSQAFIQPYLFFGGRCEEAMAFYQRTINARLEMLMYHRESPDSPPPGMLQPGFEDKVMHASLRIGDSVVMASDGCDDKSKFDGFRLSLFLASEAEARQAFAGLAENGQVMMPLTKTFWSPCFGMLTDQFGVGWMVTVAAPPAITAQA